MMKYLVLLAVLAVVYGLWRNSQRRAAPPPTPDRPAAPPARPEPMLRCAHCGVHLPQSQALLKDGRSYCCEAHQRQG